MYYLTLALIIFSMSAFTTLFIGYVAGIPVGKCPLRYEAWVALHPWLHTYSRYLFPLCIGVYFLVFLSLR